MPARWTLLAALLLLLPGCTGEDGADGRDGGGDGPNGAGNGGEGTAGPDAPLPAPEWALGDWWRYRFDGGSSSVSTRVVTGDAGADWTVESDSPDTAWFDLRSDVSTMGPVRKADLAGSQGDQRVLFFRFPLEDGAGWDMTWDGLPFTATAHRLDAERFRIDYAGTDGRVAREVVYDAAARWISSMRIEDGNGTFSATLEEAGHGYTGQVARWSAEPLLEHNDGGGGGGQYEVPDGTTDLWYQVTGGCPTAGGSFALRLAPQGAVDAPIQFQHTCPFTLAATGSVEAVPGTWQEAYAALGTEVAVEVVLRTLTMVDVQEGDLQNGK